MKAFKFWHLKWLQKNGATQLFIVDGRCDIVLNTGTFPHSNPKEYYLYQEICNLHNLTHLEEQQ